MMDLIFSAHWPSDPVNSAFKLIESVQRRWRMVNAPHLVALVRAGATFTGGQLIERTDTQPAGEAPQRAAA